MSTDNLLHTTPLSILNIFYSDSDIDFPPLFRIVLEYFHVDVTTPSLLSANKLFVLLTATSLLHYLLW